MDVRWNYFSHRTHDMSAGFVLLENFQHNFIGCEAIFSLASAKADVANSSRSIGAGLAASAFSDSIMHSGKVETANLGNPETKKGA